MPNRTNVPIILTVDGTQNGDMKEFTKVPIEADTTLGVCKDPAPGTFISLTAYHPGLGYVTARTRLNTRATKVRFIIADHPDGDD